MATQAKSGNIDLNSVFGAAASQFRGLNPNQPGQWPMLPKLATWLVLAILVVVAGWFLLLQTADEELTSAVGATPGEFLRARIYAIRRLREEELLIGQADWLETLAIEHDETARQLRERSGEV